MLKIAYILIWLAALSPYFMIPYGCKALEMLLIYIAPLLLWLFGIWIISRFGGRKPQKLWQVWVSAFIGILPFLNGLLL